MMYKASILLTTIIYSLMASRSFIKIILFSLSFFQVLCGLSNYGNGGAIYLVKKTEARVCFGTSNFLGKKLS